MSHTPTTVDHARVTVMTFYLPSIPASLQTLGRCECVAACALAPLGLRIISPLTFYLSFLGAIWTYDKNLAPIFPSHIYIYRPPSCPKVCQTVGPFPISEFARLRSFTFHHPPRVCQTLSSSKSFHFFFVALPCPLLPIKGSGCHPLALTFHFNLRTSTCLLALSTSTFLSMFLSTAFPQLSFKSTRVCRCRQRR